MNRTNNILLNLSKRYASKWLVLLFDLLVVVFTFFLAYLFKYNFEIAFNFKILIAQIPLVLITACFSFILVNSHKSILRLQGTRDILNTIIGSLLLATFLSISTYFITQYNNQSVLNISITVIVIHFLLNVFFLVSFKLFIQFIYQTTKHNSIISTQKEHIILIYGAGSCGINTYNTFTKDSESNIKIFGFIDDNKNKIGKKINCLEIYDSKKITAEFIENNNIDEVIISIQNISSEKLLEITKNLLLKSIKVKIAPPTQHLVNRSLNTIKDLNIEDLLGRAPIHIENPELIKEYDNKVIVVSGASGSIGSEIARKLSKYNYKKLILIDIAESPLYELQQEFILNKIENFEIIIANIRDEVRLNQIFSQIKPQIIFHAAAYKHVPLMEDNPYEAVNVNIEGTLNISNLAIKYNVDKFVMISTDKAVNPTNIMGATKRISELYISSLNKKGSTKFIITRFGNVLGSNGSVIPQFKKQILNGGPITVTHKEITRYFMTIQEACSLVLEAATMGNGGEIFVFDMGKSIKIFDLAISMITLSGLKYPDDINIEITGLRPGEKIYEELLASGEKIKPTYNEKIRIAESKIIDKDIIIKQIIELNEINKKCEALETVSKIKKIIPEYISNNSKFEILDQKK